MAFGAALTAVLFAPRAQAQTDSATVDAKLKNVGGMRFPDGALSRSGANAGPLPAAVLVIGTVGILGRIEFEPEPAIRSNNKLFTEEVVRTLPKWQFTPASRDGEPVTQRVCVTVMFAIVANAKAPPKMTAPAGLAGSDEERALCARFAAMNVMFAAERVR